MSNRPSLLIFALCASPCLAEAYIGPGVGISAIGSFLALLGAILLAVVGFVWFPLKRRFFRKKAKEEAESDGVDAESVTVQQTGDAPDDASRRTPGG